ncbi:hypothetical protein PsYK624_117180 [Phanerochaete sordida]|uniref:Uncharacterized protein n=1 Tax=Phanerochaete sordida TaxID=48140 RepID=A0A9P3LHY9_9APHY|nr:hypothetical protein PsYK624_117180 [Phanerochaete sordida]
MSLIRVVAQRDPGGFKHLLDAVPRGTVFPRLRAAQRINLWHDASADTTMATILSISQEHWVDGSVVALTPLERFESCYQRQS